MKRAPKKVSVQRRILVIALLCSGGFCAARSLEWGPRRTTKSAAISESALLELRNRQDVAGMRDHSWRVFSEITQPSDLGDPESPPIWDTWEDKDDVFGGKGRVQVAKNRHRAIELPIEVLASIRSANADENAALKEALAYVRKRKVGPEVLFNPSAAEHIRRHRLYDGASLKKRWTMLNNLHSPISETSIVPFPSDSIVLKAMWLTVGPTSPEVLSVWEPPDQRIVGCEDGCGRDILVKLAAPGQKCNLSEQNSAAVLSSCFYSVPSAKDGYRLILFGLHVATKEIQDWTWSTFWWQRNPDIGPYKEGRLDENSIRGYWRNYVMDTTLSMVTPEDHPRSALPSPKQRCQISYSATAKICFNPYLELGMRNGELSNCVNCHRQATFPAMYPDPRGVPQRGYLSSDDSCFGERNEGSEKWDRVMKVDYMWSLSAIDPNTPLGHFVADFKAELALDAK